MSQQQLLTEVRQALEEIGVPYMVTGSTASSLHGQPRATNDVDIVVRFETANTKALLSRFPPPRYYLSESAIQEAVEGKTEFNLIDTTTGAKADFWVLGEDPFDQEHFRRRAWVDIDGARYPVSTPEDSILAKLRWAKLCGGSEKQMHDALRVLQVQSTAIDRAYVDAWAGRLDVMEDWESLKRTVFPGG